MARELRENLAQTQHQVTTERLRNDECERYLWYSPTNIL